MKELIENLYRYCFARPYFFKLNSYLHSLALNGMGVMNWKTSEASGETHFLRGQFANRRDAVVIDVGAHTGAYVRAICDLSPTTRVFAFEPHPATFARLASLTWPANVHLVNAGVGSQAGAMTLFDYAGDDGSEHASLLRGVIETIHKAAAVEHQVEIKTLDDFAIAHGLTFIDLLKIDTEGNELDVLKGATRLIGQQAIRVVQFEFNAMNVISKSFLADFMALLQGYEFFRLLPRGWIPIHQYEARLHEIFAFQNIVAVSASAGKRLPDLTA